MYGTFCGHFVSYWPFRAVYATDVALEVLVESKACGFALWSARMAVNRPQTISCGEQWVKSTLKQPYRTMTKVMFFEAISWNRRVWYPFDWCSLPWFPCAFGLVCFDFLVKLAGLCFESDCEIGVFFMSYVETARCLDFHGCSRAVLFHANHHGGVPDGSGAREFDWQLRSDGDLADGFFVGVNLQCENCLRRALEFGWSAVWRVNRGSLLGHGSLCSFTIVWHVISIWAAFAVSVWCLTVSVKLWDWYSRSASLRWGDCASVFIIEVTSPQRWRSCFWLCWK